MTRMKSKTRAESEEKYREARLVAMATLEPEVRHLTGLEVRLMEIDLVALAATEVWRAAYSDVGRLDHVPGWDWYKEARRFGRRSRRLELAIWVGDTLCGLALGRISDRRVVATIHLLEGNPTGNPLGGKVILIATRFLEVLALALGCREAAIDSPVSGLVARYQSAGFVKEVTKGKKIVRLAKSVAP
ncbi:hypothetical protein [Janthinobacterium lividum]|nr:hypothetical protein [Janthinobacterium lividum]MDQ4685486.1 hypothetical protein [Janthinobacterium lividum]